MALFSPPTGRARYDVLSVGLNSVDEVCVVPSFPPVGTKWPLAERVLAGGGQAATAAYALARWGLRVAYLGCFGDDAAASFSRSSLESAGVDTRFGVTAPGVPNQYSVVVADAATGERTILWQRDPRLALQPADIPEEAIAQARVVHLDGHDLPAQGRVAHLARESGRLLSLDAERVFDGTRELVALTDLCVACETFPGAYTGRDDLDDAMQAIADQGPRVVVTTLGTRGAVGFAQGRLVRVPAFPVEARDTTGAGDVFHAGCIYGVLQGWDLQEVLRFACGAAALKCRKLGGRAGVEPVESILSFVRIRDAAQGPKEE